MAIKSNHAEKPFCFCTNSNFFCTKNKKTCRRFMGIEVHPKSFLPNFWESFHHFISTS